MAEDSELSHVGVSYKAKKRKLFEDEVISTSIHLDDMHFSDCCLNNDKVNTYDIPICVISDAGWFCVF